LTQISHLPLDPGEAAKLQQTATRLERLLEASDKFVGPSSDPPVAGSRFDRARKADLGEPYDFGYLLLFAGEDHLRTLLTVIKSGYLPGFSLYSLLRVAGEAIVRCRHLLDPAITETERFARGLNERLDNLVEQRKAKPDAEGLKHYADRLSHLEGRALANGITPIGGPPATSIKGFGAVQPSIFDLFDTYFVAGSTTCRYLGAFIHIKPWVVIRRERAQPTSDPRVANVPTDINVHLFTDVVDGMLDVHDACVGYWLGLAGYPPEVWREAKKTPAQAGP